MTVGQSIRGYRKKLGLTQAQLGARCGITAGAVSSYENGVTVPRRGVVEKLARALGVAPDRLTEVPDLSAAGEPPSGDGLLYDGVLALLKQLYGPVEGRVIVGENGARRRYYVVGDFVVHDSDVAAIVRWAKASISPVAQYMRRAREVAFDDSGNEYQSPAEAERLNAG